MTFDITEDIPFDLSGRSEGAGFFSVAADAFDIAVGTLPFLMYIGENAEYERAPAPWRKDQFDNQRNVGEQSLTGWWLRSQADFGGGSGITYHEPLQGEGSENRFRDSRGVDVLVEAGEVSLLAETEEIINLGGSSISLVAGDTRLLVRDGNTVKVWNGTSLDTVTLNGFGATDPVHLAYTGSLFLIGHNTGIDSLPAGSGTSSTQLWNSLALPGDMKPYWLKQRIFATSGPKIYELTLAGGDPDSPDATLYEHPDPNWTWTSIAETGGGVWAAGFSGDKSAVHVITIDADGTTPALNGGTVAIQMPDGERVRCLLGYLDFLFVGTSEGLRVAATEEARASLGPLVFDDAEVFSLSGRGDFAWAGLSAGVTRKVALGFQIGESLDFAWANDLESTGSGEIQALAWFEGRLCLGHAGSGVWQQHETDLVESGYLATGFARFGTLEPKFFDSLRVTADCSAGTIGLGTVVTDVESGITTLTSFNGSRDVQINLPGDRKADRLSIVFTLNRSLADPSQGPILQSYQIRALPAPFRRQRLIRYPLSLFDREKDRWGKERGGPGFAWARLQVLETLEFTGNPVLVHDFRTGEARMCVVEQVTHSGPDNPTREKKNFGGRVTLTVRTVD
jgi:hypothetical protein